MRRPESNGGHVDVCVLSWLESPWSRHLDGNSAGISWKGFNQGLAASLAEVAVHDSESPYGALGYPDSNSSVKKGNLRKVGELEMVVDGDDYQNYQCDVQILERLVERMPDNRTGLDGDGDQSDSALKYVSSVIKDGVMGSTHNESVHLHGISRDCLLKSRPTSCGHSRGRPSDRVSKSLKDDNSSSPSVK